MRPVPMERKNETLNLRVSSEMKELVRMAAERDRRTISNFLEVLVREHCKLHQIVVGEAKRPKNRR
jgi:uncharacterized protein (DUF1778 family)